jgi:hypothetical protein
MPPFLHGMTEFGLRRQRWIVFGLIAMAVTGVLPSRLKADPSAITSVRVESINVVPNNQGDTWDPAWARDGTIYSPSDDGSGFRSNVATNVHFNKMTGDSPEKLDGETVNPMAEYGKAIERSYDSDYGANHSYGPASFLYDVPGTPIHDAPAVTGAHLGFKRADYDDYVGIKFTTGGSALGVKALGRWVAPGSTASHPVEIIDGATSAVVATATVNTAGQAAGKFAYVALAHPVTLAANHAYFLLSLETKGGDDWFDDDTVLTSSRDITINTPEFHSPGGYFSDGRTWKSSGCLALDGALYLVVARHHYGPKQSARNASIIKSLDGGKTWMRPAQDNLDHPMFPGFGFATPYFIDYGQDGHQAVADGSDRYVYAMSNNGFWDNGDKMVLGRVRRDKIGDLSASDWQFLKGGDGANDANWSSSMDEAGPVIDSRDHLGMGGPVYLPAQKCYFMIGWYYPAGSARITLNASQTTNWDFYVAAHPWGPWHIVGSHQFYPQGYYNPQVCLKWSSPDGSLIRVLAAGDFNAGTFPLACISLSVK